MIGSVASSSFVSCAAAFDVGGIMYVDKLSF